MKGLQSAGQNAGRTGPDFKIGVFMKINFRVKHKLQGVFFF